MRCGACGKTARVMKRALVNGEKRNVCGGCAKRAFLVCVSSAACACGNAATLCGSCARSKEDKAKVSFDAKEAASVLEKRAKVYRASDETHTLGIAEGLEMAVSYLRSGRW